MTKAQFPKIRWTTYVLRTVAHDCTLGGITSRHKNIEIVSILDTRYDPKGIVRWESPYTEPYDGAAQGTLVIRAIGGAYWHVEPFTSHGRRAPGMFGGNWVDAGWQFDDLAKRLDLEPAGPGARIIPVHDRYES